MKTTIITAIFFVLSVISTSFAEAQTIVVQKGECFWKIAVKNRFDFEELKKINRHNLKIPGNYDMLYVGQRIELPIKKTIKKEARIVSASHYSLMAAAKAKYPVMGQESFNNNLYQPMKDSRILKIMDSNEQALIIFSFCFFIFCLSVCFVVYACIRSYLDLKHSTIKKDVLDIENVSIQNNCGLLEESLSDVEIVDPNSIEIREIENKKHETFISKQVASIQPICRIGYEERLNQYFLLPNDYNLLTHKYGSIREIAMEMVAISRTLNSAVEELLELKFEKGNGRMSFRPLDLSEINEFQQAVSAFTHY